MMSTNAQHARELLNKLPRAQLGFSAFDRQIGIC